MKVGIVGAGMVGSAAAYAIASTRVVSSVVVIDKNPKLAAAQAADISDAGPYIGSIPVHDGEYADLRGAGIVLIAAGVSQKPGESRLELLGRNASVFADVIARISRVAPDAILLVATNPVDIMTAVTTRLSAVDPSRVIGSGTILDTARFRMNLSRYLKISPQSIHAHVLGEHGDSEVLLWSSAECGTMSLEQVAKQRGCPLTDEVRAMIDGQVRNAAQSIISGKGSTWFGIGAGLAEIVKAIALDQHKVLTVSSLTKEIAGVNDVCLSLPRILGAKGIEDTLLPSMAQEEMDALGASARMLKEAYDAI